MIGYLEIAQVIPQLVCRARKRILVELCLHIATLNAKAYIGAAIGLTHQCDTSLQALGENF